MGDMYNGEEVVFLIDIEGAEFPKYGISILIKDKPDSNSDKQQ